MLGTRVQPVTEAPALVVTCLHQAATRGGNLAYACGDLGLKTHVDDSEARCGGDRVDQLAVCERGRVVYKGRHRLTLVVDKRDGPAVPARHRDGAAGLVDPVVDTCHPVGHLDIRIAQAARERRPQRVRLESVAEVDHESSDGGTGPTAPQQVSRQAG